MRPIWKGSISFGLVTIPVQVLPATAEAEKVKFNLLRKTDLSPIRFKRVAEADNREVAWEDIVKGYQYEKGKYVIFTDEDFGKVELESVDSIAIQEFVDVADINPIFFDKPYYLEPLKGGGPAYGLLRDVLGETGKVGIAKVAMRNRQHLAAVKANGPLLVLELMHFPQEIASPGEVRVPESRKVGAREKSMAKTLVDQMSAKWNPDQYSDEYTDAVMKLVEKKIAAGGKELPGKPRKGPSRGSNVIDLAAVLQESLKGVGIAKKAPSPTARAKRGGKAARGHKHAA